MTLIPQDSNFIRRVKTDFAKQAVMQTMGIELVSVEAGRVVLAMPYAKKLTQQNGFLHAGVVTTGLDTACGYAAFSLMPENAGVLSIEFKMNMLRPSIGDRFTFVGEVLKAGRQITVVEGKAYAHKGDSEKLVASINASMMTVLPKP